MLGHEAEWSSICWYNFWVGHCIGFLLNRPEDPVTNSSTQRKRHKQANKWHSKGGRSVDSECLRSFKFKQFIKTQIEACFWATRKSEKNVSMNHTVHADKTEWNKSQVMKRKFFLTKKPLGWFLGHESSSRTSLVWWEQRGRKSQERLRLKFRLQLLKWKKKSRFGEICYEVKWFDNKTQALEPLTAKFWMKSCPSLENIHYTAIDNCQPHTNGDPNLLSHEKTDIYIAQLNKTWGLHLEMVLKLEKQQTCCPMVK